MEVRLRPECRAQRGSEWGIDGCQRQEGGGAQAGAARGQGRRVYTQVDQTGEGAGEPTPQMDAHGVWDVSCLHCRGLQGGDDPKGKSGLREPLAKRSKAPERGTRGPEPGLGGGGGRTAVWQLLPGRQRELVAGPVPPTPRVLGWAFPPSPASTPAGNTGTKAPACLPRAPCSPALPGRHVTLTLRV